MKSKEKKQSVRACVRKPTKARQKRDKTTKTAHAQRTQKGGGPATHICHRCRHREIQLAMQRASWQQDETGEWGYGIWSQGRADYLRRHHIKYPQLVWLCWKCVAEESKPREV